MRMIANGDSINIGLRAFFVWYTALCRVKKKYNYARPKISLFYSCFFILLYLYCQYICWKMQFVQMFCNNISPGVLL